MAQEKDRLAIATLVVETVAAIGVIFSVIYLAVQVSGSTAALRAQTHNNVLTQGNQPLLVALNNPDLGVLVDRGMGDPEALSKEEWSRFTNYLFMAINSWEYTYYLDQDEATPPEIWDGMDAYYSEIANIKPGLKRFWSKYEHYYAEPFHSYADQFFSAEIPVAK
jgi:hypothetical protein